MGALDLILNLLDRHPGSAVLVGIGGAALIYNQASLMLDIRWIRRHLHNAPTAKDFEQFKSDVHDVLAVQSDAIADEYPKRLEVLTMIKHELGGSNGKAHGKAAGV